MTNKISISKMCQYKQLIWFKLEKAPKPEIKLSTFAGLQRKQGNSKKKKIYFCFIDYAKAFVWITTNWKILREVGIPDHITCLLRNLYAGQEAKEPNMEQWASSKSRKENIKAVYCHLAYLTSMQSTSCEMPGWVNHKVEANCGESIKNLRYADDPTLMAESKEELKSFLKKVKEDSGLNSILKKKIRSWHLVPLLCGK